MISKDLPPRFRKAMSRPSEERRSWTAGLAGVLIGTYLWAAFTDPLGRETLAVGGLWPALLGAWLGGALAARLLFEPAARLGVRTRHPFMVVAAGSFGAAGSTLVPGLLLGVAQLLWFAVAVHYGVDFNLRGLAAVGFIEDAAIRSPERGLAVHRSPVYAVSVLLWGLAAAAVATRFIRWIAALMIVYPIFSALVYAGAMLWALPGLPRFEAPRADNAAGVGLSGAWVACGSMIQLVFGFSAMVATQAVNWGGSLRNDRDARWASWVGVGLASAILATLSLLIVAGRAGRESRGPLRSADAFTLGEALEHGIGGLAGGVGLMILGLASLASAVYAAYAYSNRFEAIRKRPRRWAWGLIGAVVAFPIEITGLASNVPLIIDLTAGAIAPVFGVLAADAWRHRGGSWPAPRPGARAAGLVPWAVGAAIGLAPAIARAADWPVLGGGLPAALIAFGVAFAGTLAWVDRPSNPSSS